MPAKRKGNVKSISFTVPTKLMINATLKTSTHYYHRGFVAYMVEQ